MFYGRHKIDVPQANYNVVVVHGGDDVHFPHNRSFERVTVLQRFDDASQAVGIHSQGFGVAGAVSLEGVQFGRHSEWQLVDGRVKHIVSVVFQNQQAVP